MMDNLRMQRVVVGPISTNCYLIQNEDTKKLVIVDPGDEPLRIQRKIEQMHGIPEAILLTHGHYDHIQGIEIMRRYFPSVRFYACEKEKELLEDPDLNCAGGMEGCLVRPDFWVRDGEHLHLADYDFEVMETPGHTRGSVCYYLEKEGILLAGDTLFYESYGRTDLPTGSDADMQESLEKLLLKLPESTRVFPGHGEDTTIGHERAVEGLE